jgi:hypothetical protein
MPDQLPTVQGDQGYIEAYPVMIVNPAGQAANLAPASSAAAVTSIASSATAVTLLTANANRKGATIYNESTSVVFIKFGTVASATSYTVQVAPSGYYEIPFGYTGIITAIWTTANGSARITELS